jgi:hypothetical protein
MHNLSELATDKEFLRPIANNAARLPEDIEAFTFIQALLPNLGSTDAELRDMLTYPVMAHLILDEQDQYRLTGAHLEELLLTCIDQDHLFYQIGESGADSVFMRTFSSLMFPLIFIADAGKPRVSENVAKQVKDALLTYSRQERDWRGYVKGKGWAHSVAHHADALDDCSRNRYMTRADREAILETLTYLAQLPEPLCHEEDDRLAFVAYGIITRQEVELSYLKKWIASFVIPRAENVLVEESVINWHRAANAKNFLRGLYFMLSWSKVPALAEQKAELLAEIEQALQKLNSLPTAWFASENQG